MEQEQRPRTGPICRQPAHGLTGSFVVFAFYGHCCPHVEIAGYYSLEVELFCLSQAHYEEKKVIPFGCTSRKKKTKQANLAIIECLFTAQNEKVKVDIFSYSPKNTKEASPGFDDYKQYLIRTAIFY